MRSLGSPVRILRKRICSVVPGHHAHASGAEQAAQPVPLQCGLGLFLTLYPEVLLDSDEAEGARAPHNRL